MDRLDNVEPADKIDLISTNDGEHQIEIESLLNSIGDGAIMSDEFGRIIRINPAALAILGYEEKELVGKFFPKALVAMDETGRPD